MALIKRYDVCDYIRTLDGRCEKISVCKALRLSLLLNMESRQIVAQTATIGSSFSYETAIKERKLILSFFSVSVV